MTEVVRAITAMVVYVLGIECHVNVRPAPFVTGALEARLHTADGEPFNLYARFADVIASQRADLAPWVPDTPEGLAELTGRTVVWLHTCIRESDDLEITTFGGVLLRGVDTAGPEELNDRLSALSLGELHHAIAAAAADMTRQDTDR